MNSEPSARRPRQVSLARLPRPRWLQMAQVAVSFRPRPPAMRSNPEAQTPLRRGLVGTDVGLSGEAVDRYVGEWAVAITDVTETARRIQGLLRAGDDRAAEAQLPVEEPYPLPVELATGIDAR